MAPPTAKEQYDRLYAKLATQYRGVQDGVTSRVTSEQLRELSRLQDACVVELGGTPAPASGHSSISLGEWKHELEQREAALKQRAEEMKLRDMEYDQQEVLLQSLKEENEVWREKARIERGGKRA